MTPGAPNPEHTADKAALIKLAWGGIIVLAFVVGGPYIAGEKVPNEAWALLGSIVTGMAYFPHS